MSSEIKGFRLGKDSDKVLYFSECDKGFTIDTNDMKDCEVFWVMLHGTSYNFAIKGGRLQFWEPEPITEYSNGDYHE